MSSRASGQCVRRSVAKLILLAGLAACGKNNYDRATAEVETIAAKMCACTDVVCVAAVEAEYETWRSTVMDRNQIDGKEPPERLAVRFTTAVDSIPRCARKVRGEPAEPSSR